MLVEQIDELVETYSDTLLRISMHYVQNITEGEDIVQDVFVKYIQKAPTFHTEEHQKAWLIRVTVNTCKDQVKHWWKKKRVYSEMENTSYTEQKKEVSILPLIKQLPAHHRIAIYLFYYEDMSITEIADVLQVKEPTVSSWLFRGRKKLRKLVEERRGSDEEI